MNGPVQIPGIKTATLVWVALLAGLVSPIWRVDRVPTQDGPAHVYNAVVIREFGTTGTDYDCVFAFRDGPLPNWTSHAVLVGLMSIVDPVTAEKLLVTLVVVAMALAVRFFLASYGAGGFACASMALAFLYPRFLFMGFYNFGLGIAGVFAIWGWVASTPQWRARNRTGLAVAFVLLFFTHLVALLFAIAAALWVSTTARKNRLRNTIQVGLSTIPALGLVAAYECHVKHDFTAALRCDPVSTLVDRIFDLAECVHQELFGPIDDANASLGIAVAVGIELLVLLSVWDYLRGRPGNAAEQPPSRWPLVVGFAVSLCCLVLIPDSLGTRGGELRTRFAIFPPVLLLACCRVPDSSFCRTVSGWGATGLVVATLVLVTQTFQSASREVSEFTSGIDAVPPGRILFVIREAPKGRPFDPIEHAPNWYGTAWHAVNLDNYEAATTHFPLVFRDGWTRGNGNFVTYARRDEVDTILVWSSDLSGIPVPDQFRATYSCGRLHLFCRK